MNLRKRYDLRVSPDWLVWRGEEPTSGRLVIVKEVNPGSSYPDALAGRLAAEYKLLAGLNHPHLLRPVADDPARRRVLFEDAQCSLAQYLVSHGRLAPADVARVLLQAAAGLEHLHANKLLHGTVGPHTLLVGPAGDVKFGDFGGHPLGSDDPLPVPDPDPRYQAPELIDGSLGRPGPTADLYCLGYLGLELLAGDTFPALFGLPAGSQWLAWHADPDKDLVDWRAALAAAPTALLDILAGLLPKPTAARQFPTARQLRTALQRSGLASDQRLAVYRHPEREPGRPSKVAGAVLTRPADRPEAFAPPPSSPRPRRSRPAAGKPTRRPSLVLKPINIDGGPRTFPHAKPVLVGRSNGCDLQLGSRAVSPKHAVLLCGPDGRWRAIDLKSSAGMFVNGERVRKARLHAGDELYFAGMGMRVELDDRPPRRPFDEFELHEKLHAGPRGVVYRATWTARDGREAAVRVHPKAFGGEEAAVKRFLRGVPAAARLKHPNLVQLYRGGIERVGTTRAWFLATEYLPGGSLRQKLKKGKPLAPAAVIALGRQLCAGLAALWDAGWVHRNICPGSVIFGGDGTAKLGDFGFVRPAAGGGPGVTTASAAARIGDAAYQAPEQLLGAPTTDVRADLYSLGAVLYEAATGQPPFPPDLPFPELCERVRNRRTPRADQRNPAVPPALAVVLARLLEKDPADRYPTPRAAEQALAEALAEALTGASV